MSARVESGLVNYKDGHTEFERDLRTKCIELLAFHTGLSQASVRNCLVRILNEDGSVDYMFRNYFVRTNPIRAVITD